VGRLLFAITRSARKVAVFDFFGVASMARNGSREISMNRNP
jgi:hypothetical protein